MTSTISGTASQKFWSRTELLSQDAILGFSGPLRLLSNAAPCRILFHGIAFPTVDHAFQAAKIDPTDPRWIPQGEGPEAGERAARLAMEAIARLSGAADARLSGRQMQFLRPDWKKIRAGYKISFLRQKFRRADLAELLAATGARPLLSMETRNQTWSVVPVSEDRLVGDNLDGDLLSIVRREVTAALWADHEPEGEALSAHA